MPPFNSWLTAVFSAQMPRVGEMHAAGSESSYIHRLSFVYNQLFASHAELNDDSALTLPSFPTMGVIITA